MVEGSARTSTQSTIMSAPVDSPTHQADLPGLLPSRACRACVSIKAKCVPLAASDGKSCERCHRLGKSCTTPQPKVRKRPTVRVQSKDRPSLSDHCNTSASLSSPQPHQVIPPQSTATVPSLQKPTSTYCPQAAILTPSTSSTEDPPGTIRTTTYPTRPDVSVVPDTSPRYRAPPVASSAFDISPEIGHTFIYPAHEKLFEYFRDQMSSHFPFVVLTEETAKMRQERPFTYVACVMAAAHSDPTLQYRLSQDTLKFLAERMLVRGEKSLDLLQGLLIMVNWYYVHRNSNPQLMNLVHLAKSLLIDLGLNRASGTVNFQIPPSNEANRFLHGHQQDTNQHTSEGHRACLGVYHIQSKLAACYRRLDTMPWSEHIEECCQILSSGMDRPSDPYAVALVRLDHLVDRYKNIEGGPQKLAMPLSTYVKLFSADIESFEKHLPMHLQVDTDMKLHIQTSQICLFERVLSSDCDVSSQKVEALHACLAGVVNYVNSFIAQKLENFASIAFLSWSTMAHAFDIYAKLSFVDVENWDLEYVRHNPGFIAISDALIDTLRKAEALENIRWSKNISVRFRVAIQRMELFKQWYSSRIDAEAKVQAERLATSAEASTADDDLNNNIYFSDFADLVWQDFTTDWSWFDNASS